MIGGPPFLSEVVEDRRKTGARPHVGTARQHTPEMPHLVAEEVRAEHAIAGGDALLVEVELLLERSAGLLGEDHPRIGAVGPHGEGTARKRDSLRALRLPGVVDQLLRPAARDRLSIAGRARDAGQNPLQCPRIGRGTAAFGPSSLTLALRHVTGIVGASWTRR